ncbi:MAG: M16 family metallopeptidase [Methanomassiliicoccales archaeon]
MVEVKQLNCGARLAMEEIPYLHSVAIGIFVNVGSRDESEELGGVSHLLEHMLFKGTSRRSARDIAETFEGIGGQLNAYTAREYTCYYARCLDENLDLAMDVLFDMVVGSVIGEKELDTERGVIIEEINMYEDTPDDLIHDVFSQLVWDGESIGRSILGRQELIAAVSPSQVRNFYQQHYIPENMVVAVAGNISSQQVEASIEQYLSVLTNNTSTERVRIAPQSVSGIRLLPKDTEQIQLCIGQGSISYHDEQRYAQNVMNNILGGGISSRLFQSIREERGLAYSVYTYPSLYSDTGSYAIYAGIGTARLEEFFAALQEQLDGFLLDGVTDEEVRRTQTMLKTNTLLGMESVMNRMNRIGKSLLYYNQVVPTEQFIEKISQVTPIQIKEYAHMILDNKGFSLASIGPEDVLKQVKQQFTSRWGDK